MRRLKIMRITLRRVMRRQKRIRKLGRRYRRRKETQE